MSAGDGPRERDWRRRVMGLAEDLLENLGYELVDIDYPGGENGVLRLFVDREGGVTLDDCAHVSRMFGALLDVEDPISGRYYLEISSPGLNRRLRRYRDFADRIGETVKLRLAVPVAGRRRFTGTLKACQPEPLRISVEVDGELFEFELHPDDRCNLVYKFA